jgi:orotate phosphoribosyltransferase
MVVGIPRSGLLVANLLALYTNLPITDLDGFLEGRVIGTGTRYMPRRHAGLEQLPQKVLVVDDTVLTGREMNTAKSKIALMKPGPQVLYGAVYMSPGNEKVVDYFYELLPARRVFEWNVFHHGGLSSFCIDIDGVLCRDPTSEENDDGQGYMRFIEHVEPWIVPDKTVGWLVTCRLEKYRRPTEQWLERNGIKYQHLIMMDLPDKMSRVRSGSHGTFKGRVYKETDSALFIESSFWQATEIARLSGKDVLCMETREMVRPSSLSRNYHRGYRLAKLAIQNPSRVIKFLRKRLGIEISRRTSGS